jgi:OmcA/MtrC family decaheme c-type cytochrome
VICHTDQRKYGNAEATVTSTTVAPPTGSTSTSKINGLAVGNLVAFLHRLHMGEELQKTGYNYGGIAFNEVAYPQDQRNCVMCHDGTATSAYATPQGDNWKNVPSRLACGACHDSVDFVTGLNHGTPGLGGIQLNDTLCANCHSAASITISHTPVVAPDVAGFVPGSHTNGSSIAAFKSNLPAGAHQLTYDLKSVTLNSSSQPVVTFRFILDGAPALFNPAPAAADPTVELLPNFIGSPSVYVAFGVPQDGIAAPADWNATVNAYVRNVWNKTVTTSAMAGPDASGYYSLTILTALPATATQITGGIGYVYSYSSMPLTQTDVPNYPYDSTTKLGGLSVPAPNVSKVVSGTLPTGFGAQSARRAIVSNQKCNDCHAYLGIFTKKVYHAGERNDAPTCTFCHNANYVGDHGSDGWADNEKDFVHAIHGSAKRVNKFSWQAAQGYWNVTYPAILNNCEACHVPGSYDFSASANAAAVPNLLWSTAAANLTPATASTVVITTGNETLTGLTVISPFITPGVDYGKAFAYNATTKVTTPAAGTTLVNSPITSACSACHDGTTAVAHMQNNGGSFYQPRVNPTTSASVFTTNVEQCLLCHGTGKVADIKAVHMNFK